MIDVFIGVFLVLVIYFNLRSIKLNKFLAIIRRAEFDYAFAIGYMGKDKYPISDRLKFFRLLFSFRPLKYENYIWPQELDYLMVRLLTAETDLDNPDY